MQNSELERLSSQHSFGPSLCLAVLWMFRFPNQYRLHDFAGVGRLGRQRPVEAFGRGQLTGRTVGLAITPKPDKPANGPSAPAQLSYFFTCNLTVGMFFGQRFGLFNQPFDEDAGLRIAEPASQRLVFQNKYEKWFRECRQC